MLVTVKEVVSVQYADDVVAQILSVGLEVKSSVAARNAYEVHSSHVVCSLGCR